MGTLPGLDSNGVTIEMGSLYYPTGDNSPNAPDLSGTLLKFTVCHVFNGCTVEIRENTARGGVVLTNPTIDPTVTIASPAYTFVIVTTVTISGTVSGSTQAGVTMSGLPGNPVTDGSGNYTGTVPNGWSGTVTPTKTNYTFTPANRVYSNVTSDKTGENYTADCLYVGRVFAATAGSSALTVTQTMVTKWVWLGKPNCWCCVSEKRGNGVYTGGSANRPDNLDLNTIKNLSAWMQQYTAAGYKPCSDVDLSGKIDNIDLNRVKNLANWMVNVGAGPPCQ
jgi:hypothetical protein